jgi:hypothetical protein
MPPWWSSGWCALGMALLAIGCAHSSREGGSLAAAVGDNAVKPPLFINGPVVLLLTNLDSYAAHVTLEAPAGTNSPETVSGTLVSRGGKVMFAPEPAGSAGKAVRASGISFIWDGPGNNGYVLSDALQGYAPISAVRRVTNVVVRPGASGSARETIEGHACAAEEVTIATSDGAVLAARVWRAEDLKGVPLRIVVEGVTNALTLRLSQVRFEAVSQGLFSPPDGFSRYETAESMMNELGLRAVSGRKRPGFEHPDHPDTPTVRHQGPGRI